MIVWLVFNFVGRLLIGVVFGVLGVPVFIQHLSLFLQVFLRLPEFLPCVGVPFGGKAADVFGEVHLNT